MKSNLSDTKSAGRHFNNTTEPDFYINKAGRLIVGSDQNDQELPALDFLCTANRNLHNYSAGIPSRMGLNKVPCFSY